MAVYKVPQDVEAEDKLIGPFSFRQFIYLIVAAMGILIAWFLSRLFMGLIVIPLPLIFFFLILALPLKKDQPMETYLTAVVRFFMKPRRRLWQPEGTIQLVTITAPRVEEGPAIKNFTGQQAAAQLDYLARVVDTGGWATRGVINSASSVSDIVVAESESATDVFDRTNNVGHHIDQIITQADQIHRKEVMAMMHDPRLSSTAGDAGIALPTIPGTAQSQPPAEDDLAEPLHYDPYPSSMHQKILSPHPETDQPKPAHPHAGNTTPHMTVTGERAMTRPQTRPTTVQNQPQAPSEMRVSPDIIRLANDNNLSISSIAKEAHRLAKAHQGDDQEVVIKLH